MSTSAMVGTVALDNRTYEAAMVGYDGYPKGLGAKLGELVAAHGVTRVLAQVLSFREWRYIFDGGSLPRAHEREIPGYGVADTSSEYPWATSEMHTGSTDDLHRTPAAWSYLFGGVGGDNEALYVYHGSDLVARVASAALPQMTVDHWEQITFAAEPPF